MTRLRERGAVHGARARSASASARHQRPRRTDEAGSHEDRLLARYAATRDPVALDELVERFTPLARKLASRYRGGREPFEDLLQIANLGLVNAIHRFDPARGVSFTSFAAPTILGELRRHFRDRGWAVHVPRELQERAVKVEKALAELPAKTGRSPSVAQVAQRVGLTSEEVLEAMEASSAHHADSIDRSIGGDEEATSTVGDLLGTEEPGYDVVEYGAAIVPALAELSARDRLVLHLRFVEDLTQTEIATRVGCSQMHVSRILRATVRRLREASADG